jgi:hypothetical protein
MKRLHLFIIAAMLFSFSFYDSKAQTLERGSKRTDWGLILVSKEYTLYGFNVEKAPADNFTLGFSLMSQFASFDKFDAYLLPTIKGTYYFGEFLKLDPKVDVYAGLGFTKSLNVFVSDKLNVDTDLPGGLSLNVGGRYFLNERFGFKGEFLISKNAGKYLGLGLFVSLKK